MTSNRSKQPAKFAFIGQQAREILSPQGGSW